MTTCLELTKCPKCQCEMLVMEDGDVCGNCLRMKEMEVVDRYILWTTKAIGENDSRKFIIHQANLYADDMLEDMYEIIMAGGVGSVNISSLDGAEEGWNTTGDDGSDISGDKRDNHLCYSWSAMGAELDEHKKACEDFKKRLDGRQGGLW